MVQNKRTARADPQDPRSAEGTPSARFSLAEIAVGLLRSHPVGYGQRPSRQGGCNGDNVGPKKVYEVVYGNMIPHARRKDIAIISFFNAESAKECIRVMNGRIFKNRNLEVQPARIKKKPIKESTTPPVFRYSPEQHGMVYPYSVGGASASGVPRDITNKRMHNEAFGRGSAVVVCAGPDGRQYPQAHQPSPAYYPSLPLPSMVVSLRGSQPYLCGGTAQPYFYGGTVQPYFCGGAVQSYFCGGVVQPYYCGAQTQTQYVPGSGGIG